VWVCFGCKIESCEPSFQLCLLMSVPLLSRPGKVFKIQSKYFSTVLMIHDKNCIIKSVGMFRVQNRVIRAWFSTSPAPVVCGPEKVIKSRPKHFSSILTGNDKNCTPNSVTVFRVQNRVIRTKFSTLLAKGLLRWCPASERSSKFYWNIFKSYWQEMIRTDPNSLGMFQVQDRVN